MAMGNTRFPEVELVCTDGKTFLHSSTSDPEIEGWAEQKKQCVMQSSHTMACGACLPRATLSSDTEYSTKACIVELGRWLRGRS